jgi:hypothetical protein
MEEKTRKPRRLLLAAATGALLFALAMGTLALLPEPEIETIDRDLDFPELSTRWFGTRDASQSRLFPGDPSFRSEWTHDDGWIVSVFAYTLAPGDELDMLRGDFRENERTDGGLVLIDDQNIPAPFIGFRLIEQRIDTEGIPYTMVHYFLHDPLGRDIHQLVSIVDLNDVEYADAELRELISSAVWVPVGDPSV